jgi:hypothetical protein
MEGEDTCLSISCSHPDGKVEVRDDKAVVVAGGRSEVKSLGRWREDMEKQEGLVSLFNLCKKFNCKTTIFRTGLQLGPIFILNI